MKRRRLSILAVVGMLATLLPVGAAPAAADPGTAVFINEIHYDNASTDAGEAIEVAGPAGTDLAGWSVALYNGSSSQRNVYATLNLSGVIPDDGASGFGAIQISHAGIQNGSPDGLALVDNAAVVVQFLSYEGSFVAASGPAAGMTSTDIGVAEGSSTAVGDSLQLVGTGTEYEDFSWTGPSAHTFGAVNTGQAFTGGSGEPADPVINEFVNNHAGADSDAFVEVLGDPDTDYTGLFVLEIEGDSSTTTTGPGTVDAVLPVTTTDANGYWVDNEDAENGTMTWLLVRDFAGSVGDDLDSDNDGVLDAEPWTEVVDGIAVHDGDSSDHAYALTLVKSFDGLNPYTIGGASRIPNGTDTDAVGDWMRNDYDRAGILFGTPEIGEAFNTPGAANEAITIAMDPFGVCADPAMLISTIQGSGFSSPESGNIRTIEGVVTADYEGTGGLGGINVQEEDADQDGDPLTSEGLFVFTASSTGAQPGDVIRIRGEVTEYYGLTQITDVTDFEICGTSPHTPTAVTLPMTDAEREQVEGMLVSFADPLYVTDMYNLHRYGEAWLSGGGVIEQPTNEFAGGTPEMDALADLNMLNSILLDDASTWSDPDPIPHLRAEAYPSADMTLRLGDTTTGLLATMSYSFGEYRLQPVGDVVFDATNPRGPVPDVGGSIKVGSMNVLNYWTTIGCGNDCRGAQTPEQLEVQTDKLVMALLGMGADVLALQEVENTGFVDGVPSHEPIETLLAAMNAAEVAAGNDPVWAWIGELDYYNIYPIRNEILYRTDTVSVGDFAPMTIADPAFDLVRPGSTDPVGRPPVAQTFVVNDSGAVFTLMVNHFKSKGSSCDNIGDPDTGDGQGNCNLTRVAQAEAVLGFVDDIVAATGDSDVMVVGDMNSYLEEDPILKLEEGLVNLVETYESDPYSYVFFATFAAPYIGRGLLDHALSTGSLADQVTGTEVWHINADEPRFQDWYDPSVYAPGAFRSSDHDPVVVGLDLTATPLQAKTHAANVLDSLLPTGDRRDDWLISKAKTNVERSLNDDYWVDDTHLVYDKWNWFDGRRVFDYERTAVSYLRWVDGDAEADAQAVIGWLVAADEELAATAIAEADGGNAYLLKLAEREMKRAEADLERNRPDRAIGHYKRAWLYANWASSTKLATSNVSPN